MSSEYNSTLHLSSLTFVFRGHVHGHVTLTYKVTLDRHIVELYSFDIRDPKNLRNKKKDHRSSVTRTRDKKGHAQGHVRDLDIQGHAW